MNKPKTVYDVIVVGAGAAGCVVAGRLAERTGARIALLEAGLNDFDPLIHIPAGFAKILQKDWHVWPYDTVPAEADDRPRRYRSGRVVGGGSSINAMCYVRGQPRDYAKWQEAVGDTGAWDYETLLTHFREQEHSDTFSNKYHGTSGGLRISLPKGINPLNAACLTAFQEYGLEFNPDYNGEHQRGVSPVQGNYYNGKRYSSAVAFLRPALATGRIDLKTRATTTRILLENGRAVGVEYVHNAKSKKLFADQVVVCSGAIHTPKLLMLSGIGAPEQLEKHGIAVRAASLEVGHNLQDHPIVPLTAHCLDGYGYQRAAQGLGMVKTGLQYFLMKAGPAASNAIDTVSYFDPDDLRAEPTIQCYHVPIISEDGLSPSGKEAGITFELVVLQPESRGSIKLKSHKVEDAPLINPNFLGEKRDLDSAVKSIQVMREVMRQPSLRGVLKAEVTPGSEVKSEADLAAWAKKVATTMWHPVGTCRMGSDDRAVVDGHLRVNGVDNLRVIDASIMPNIVSGNTNAPTMALARHGCDIMIEDLKMN